MKLFALINCLFTCAMLFAQQRVERNGMTVQWQYRDGRVHFEVTAPTHGWVAIGFSKTESIEGTYLLMGRVVGDRAEVVQHFTVRAGNYPPFSELGIWSTIAHISGEEKDGQTLVRFSLPVQAQSGYERNLGTGSIHYLHYAYSTSDDFNHHSRMRNQLNIKL